MTVADFYRYCLVIFSILWLLLCSGCENEGQKQKDSEEIIHPRLEYVPYHEKMSSVSYGDSITDQSLRDFLISVNTADPEISIGGTRTGKRAEVFSHIKRVSTDSEYNIYILDSQAPAVKKYDSRGELTFIYGGVQGRKAAALYRPFDMEIVRDSLIYLSDAYGNIKILKSGEKKIEFVRADSTVFPSDMCVMDDKIFMRTVKEIGNTDDYRLVHAYNLTDGSYIRSFGPLYRSPRPESNKHFSTMGLIGCMKETNTVIYTLYENFSYLYGYSSEGDFKWVTRLPSFRGYEVVEKLNEEKETTGFSHSSKGDRVKIVSVQPVMGKYILVQSAPMSVWRSGDSESVVKSYVISAEDGEGVYRSNSMPYILHINEKYFYTNNINSYPGVKVYRYQE